MPASFRVMGPCQCEGRVLLWTANANPLVVGYTELQTVLNGLGIPSDFTADYTGDLNDYFLVIWLMAESDPPWLATATGGWKGRIHLSAEFGPTFIATINYVNTLTPFHGMTAANNTLDSVLCLGSVDPVSPHQLTSGLASLTHAASCGISGGNTLSSNAGRPWIQQNKAGNVDWVLAGDSNHLSDFCPGSATANSVFLKNLATKPIP